MTWHSSTEAKTSSWEGCRRAMALAKKRPKTRSRHGPQPSRPLKRRVTVRTRAAAPAKRKEEPVGDAMAGVHRQKARYLCGRCGRVFDTVAKLHDHQRNCKPPASLGPEGQA